MQAKRAKSGATIYTVRDETGKVRTHETARSAKDVIAWRGSAAPKVTTPTDSVSPPRTATAPPPDASR